MKRRQWRHCGAYVVNFKRIQQLVLAFLLLTLSREMPAEEGVGGWRKNKKNNKILIITNGGTINTLQK